MNPKAIHKGHSLASTQVHKATRAANGIVANSPYSKASWRRSL